MKYLFEFARRLAIFFVFCIFAIGFTIGYITMSIGFVLVLLLDLKYEKTIDRHIKNGTNIDRSKST